MKTLLCPHCQGELAFPEPHLGDRVGFLYDPDMPSVDCLACEEAVYEDEALDPEKIARPRRRSDARMRFHGMRPER